MPVIRTALLTAVALVATVLLAGCGGATPATAPSRLVDPAGFAAAVAAPGTTTVNVHVPFAGDVPGTDVSMPFDHLDPSRLPADHTAPLAIYCRTGPMSAEAARTLSGLGYTDVTELQGGMAAWTASGRPLVP